MKYSEKVADLFEVNNSEEVPYCLAHCISSDFGMGAGIVVGFNERWDMKKRLMKDYGTDFRDKFTNGCVIPVRVIDHSKDTYVLNLITKRWVFQKPTYDSLTQSLIAARDFMLENNLTKIAMPLIGCGIDGLLWSIVSSIVKKTFENTDIEVLVSISMYEG